jgi:hypothetical protein
VSKGQEAIATLQRMFGERVDPVRAIEFLVSRVGALVQQRDMMADMLGAMAFDRGTLEGIADWHGRAQQAGDDVALHDFLTLPTPGLRIEVVSPTQPPQVRLT